MSLPVGLLVGVVAIVVIVTIFLVSMRGRGRLIECPECGERFKRPALAEKRSGVGFSLPGIGEFTCPKCNYRASTSSFRYVGKDEKPPGDVTSFK